jgi:hypothetical protein
MVIYIHAFIVVIIVVLQKLSRRGAIIFTKADGSFRTRVTDGL